MAADTESVTFELEADTFTLSMKDTGKVTFKVGDQEITQDCPGASLDRETRTLKIMGREAGKIPATQDIELIASTLEGWFPPGTVHHVHDEADYDGRIQSGIVVCKFSAEWCGPCKRAAPKVAALSLQYPQVTFLHIDGDENKSIMRKEGANCYPTFFFYKDGTKQATKIEGADVAKVEQTIKDLGAQAVEVQRGDVAEATFELEVERDVYVVQKEEGGVSLTQNGKQILAPGKCPEIKVDKEKSHVQIGRSGGKLYLGGDYDLEAIATAIDAMFPTQVVHVHTEEKFDEIVRNNKHVIAKFTATWCGPCHAIAPIFTELSNTKENVVFLSIDVDKAKSLSQREGVAAMPTFFVYENGVKNEEKMLRGADKDGLRKLVKELN
jgi:thiol-disulfide isomerase/thioredoxin